MNKKTSCLQKIFYLFIFCVFIAPAFSNSSDLELQQKEWKELSTEEKYFFALSSNLIEINGQWHTNLNPTKNNVFPDSTSKSILNNSWKIFSKEDLIETINDLEGHGHAGSYRKLQKLNSNNLNLNVQEISIKYCLTVLETARLYFVREIDPILGEQGLDAWDKGRELTLIRWAYASEYISENEAFELAQPILRKIKGSYYNWEDFAAHYAAGRCFYGITEGNYKNLTKTSVEKFAHIKKAFPVLNLVFYKRRTSQKPMKLREASYEPSDEAKNWDKVVKIYYADYDAKYLNEIEELKKKFPNNPSLDFLEIAFNAREKSYFETLKSLQEIEHYFEHKPNSELNARYAIYYASICSIQNKSSLAISILEKLDTSIVDEDFLSGIYYQKGFAYAKLVGSSPSYKTNEEFASLSLENFVKAQEHGYKLPESIINWINNIFGIDETSKNTEK